MTMKKKRNIDMLREARKRNAELETELARSKTNVKVLVNECETLKASLDNAGGKVNALPYGAIASRLDWCAKREAELNRAAEAIKRARLALAATLYSTVARYGVDGTLVIPSADEEETKRHRIAVTPVEDGFVVKVFERQAVKQ